MKLPNVPRHANRFNICAVCLLVLLSAISSKAMARGFYSAVDIGQTSFDQYCQHEQPAGYTCTNTATAVRLGGGYQFSPYFGLEANYGNLGSVKLNGIWAGANVNEKAKFRTIQVSANLDLPLSDAFALIIKIGIAKTTVDASFNCCYGNEKRDYMMSVLGFGAQYDISKKIAVRAQFESQDEQSLLGGSTFSISLISAGIVWKF